MLVKAVDAFFPADVFDYEKVRQVVLSSLNLFKETLLVIGVASLDSCTKK